jgi:hypothetical protein
MPPHERIEQSQSVPNAAFEVAPNTMHDFLEMTDQGQHRQHGFNHHAVVSFAPIADAYMGRMPPPFQEAIIGKDNHLACDAIDEGRFLIAKNVKDLQEAGILCTSA